MPVRPPALAVATATDLPPLLPRQRPITTSRPAIPCTYCVAAVPPDAFSFHSSLRQLLYADCPACARVVTITVATWRRQVGASATADRHLAAAGPPQPRTPHDDVRVERRTEDLDEVMTLFAAVAGDPVAWARLVDVHLTAVWTHIGEHGLRGQQAEDVSHTVWLRLAQCLPDLSGLSVRDWLRHEVAHVCRGARPGTGGRRLPVAPGPRHGPQPAGHRRVR